MDGGLLALSFVGVYFVAFVVNMMFDFKEYRKAGRGEGTRLSDM